GWRRSGCLHGPGIAAIDLEGPSISPVPHPARARSCELWYPVVLKAPGTSHKSDAGGVVLGIIDKTALARSFNDRRARLNPPAFSVERMARVDEGVELLIGVRRDRRFGPIALAGLG